MRRAFYCPDGIQGESMSRMGRLLVAIIIGAVLVIALVIVPLYQVDWSGFREQTLWSWMELLLVPVFLAIAAYYLNDQVRRRTRQQEEERILEDALRQYFDAMNALLLDAPALSVSARMVATLRTVTVLRRLDRERMQEVINFLRDSNLLSEEASILDGARMTNMRLSELDLSAAYLHGTKLSYADLTGTDLSIADLRDADLTLADLSGAKLNAANFEGADLSGAILIGADLEGAILRGSNLQGAKLEGVFYSNDTILPDDTRWTPETDLQRFTAPTV